MTIMIRSFIAIALTTRIQSGLKEVVSQVRGDDQLPVKWTGIENIHITLNFLGDVREDLIPSVEKVIQIVTQNHSAFQVDVGKLGVFPGIDRPRIVWVGSLFEQTGIDLQVSLEEKIQMLGFEREQRAFSPHLTIGRVSRYASRKDFQNIAAVIRRYQDLHVGSMLVEKIQLFQSMLRPTGAEYRVLRIFPLSK